MCTIRVTLLDTVPDDCSRAHRFLQHQAVVTDRSADAAAAAAKALFCEAAGIIDWRRPPPSSAEIHFTIWNHPGASKWRGPGFLDRRLMSARLVSPTTYPDRAISHMLDAGIYGFGFNQVMRC
jgi:hypothetical protein